MLTNISWTAYCWSVGLLSAGWYAFTAFRFYRAEIRKLLRHNGTHPGVSREALAFGVPFQEAATADGTAAQTGVSAFAVEDPTFNDVDTLVERLKTTISQAGGHDTKKEEFLSYLRLVLSEFPNFKNSPFRASVSEFIVSECEKTQNLAISSQEAEALWQ